MAIAEFDVMQPEVGWREETTTHDLTRCGECGLLRSVAAMHDPVACRAYRRGYLAGLSDILTARER